MNDWDLLALVLIVAGFWVLGFKKLRLDEGRNKLLGNLEALQAMKQAVQDAANAIKDLAAKSATGADISADLTGLATSLESAVSGAGEPTGTTDAPTA